MSEKNGPEHPKGAPSHATDPQEGAGGTNNDAGTVIRPKASAVPEPPPPENEQPAPKKKHRWTHDPGIFWATVAGIIVVIAYTSVAAWQACLTRQQLDVSQDTEHRQLRAYMIVTDFAVSCPDCGDNSFVPSVKTVYKNLIAYRMENNGQTPAHQVGPIISWWPVAGKNQKLPKNFSFPDEVPVPTGFNSHSDIGRDQHKDGQAVIDDNDIKTFQDAAAGNSTLFVYGHVDYCDIFDEPHSTAFCFIYVLNAGEHPPLCDTFNGEIAPRHICHPVDKGFLTPAPIPPTRAQIRPQESQYRDR